MSTTHFDADTLSPGVAMTPVRQVAAMHSRGKNIEIKFGSECKTDGRTVWLPDISDKVDPFYTKMLLHGMYHEVSHVHNSDFKKLRSWMRKKRQGFTLADKKVLHSCGNALEDVRIEAIVCDEYPGINLRMHEFTSGFIERAINQRMLDPNVSIIKKLLDACYVRGRELQYLAQGKESFGFTLSDDAEALYKTICEDIVLKTSKTRSQVTIFKLAEELFGRLKHLAEEAEPEEDPQGGGGEESQPLQVDNVVRLKSGSDKYGIVTKILGNKEFEVREVSKEEAKAHLKGA